MKTIITTIITFFAVNAYSQEMTFLKDSIMSIYMENGYANKHFMPSGKTDKNDLRQGKWKDYEVVDDYNITTINGKTQQQFGAYLLYGEGEFIDDERQKAWKFFVIEDKTFRKILNKEVSFVDGKMEGICKHYFPSGKLASVANYISNEVEGEAQWYFESGQISGITFHKTSSRDGLCKYYYPNGILHYEMNFVQDNLEGNWTSYYDNGMLQETESYTNDTISGSYKYYYSNGQLWIEKEYQNGLLMNVIGSFDSLGNPRDHGTIKNGNGTVKYYTEEGKLYNIQTVESGKIVKEEPQSVPNPFIDK